MRFETINFEATDGIATITLNRPEELNALSWAMEDELVEAWATVKRDPSIIVAVVTGAGDRAFSSGLDVSAMPGEDGPPEDLVARVDRELKFTAIQNKCWKPVITAVNGMAVGGALELVAESDIVIAADHATFFDTHAKIGLVSTYAAIVLARRMPLEAVLRMVLMGGRERISAQRAYELGLVSEVVPGDRLMERARELARLLLQNSPSTMMASKKAVWESLRYGLGDALEHGRGFVRAHIDHPDWKEGAQAFREKREPRWAPPS